MTNHAVKTVRLAIHVDIPEAWIVDNQRLAIDVAAVRAVRAAVREQCLGHPQDETPRLGVPEPCVKLHEDVPGQRKFDLT